MNTITARITTFLAITLFATLLLDGCAIGTGIIKEKEGDREGREILRIAQTWKIALVRTGNGPVQIITRKGEVIGKPAPCKGNPDDLEQCGIEGSSVILVDPTGDNQRGVLLKGPDIVVTDVTALLATLHKRAQGGDILLFPNGNLLEIEVIRTTGPKAPKGASLKFLQGKILTITGKGVLIKNFSCGGSSCNSLLEQLPLLIRQGTSAWGELQDILQDALG